LEEFKEESDRDAKKFLERKKGVKDTFFALAPPSVLSMGFWLGKKRFAFSFF
jgi:hypothetical protein